MLGWFLIGLAGFFLVCTFVMPVVWFKLTKKDFFELDGLLPMIFTVVLTAFLAIATVLFLVLGIVLKIVGR